VYVALRELERDSAGTDAEFKRSAVTSNISAEFSS